MMLGAMASGGMEDCVYDLLWCMGPWPLGGWHEDCGGKSLFLEASYDIFGDKYYCSMLERIHPKSLLCLMPDPNDCYCISLGDPPNFF